MKSDASLRQMREAFSPYFPHALWCFVAPPGSGARQRQQAAELSFQIWGDPRAKQAFWVRKVSLSVYRQTRAKEAFRAVLPDGNGLLGAPLLFQERVLGYVVAAEVSARGSKEGFPLFAQAVRLFSENLWKSEELSRLSATIRPRAIALSTVHTVHRIINSTLNLDELVSRLAHLTAQVLRVHRCAIYLFDNSQRNGLDRANTAKKRWLVCKAMVGYPKKDRRDWRIPVGSGLEGRVAKSADIQLRKRVLCVPLIDEDVIGVLTVALKKDKKDFNHFDLEILTTLAEEAVIAIKNAQLYEEQRRVTLNTIQSLAVVLGSRLPQQSVLSPEEFAGLALRVAEALGLAEDQMLALRYAALLKETTKIGIPEEILKKPAKLTGEELSAIHRHTIHGAKIVQSFESLKTVAPIILYSREKYDGTGYPEGLQGEEIPIGARILSVMNAFEAIVIGRPYRGQSSQAEALAELQRNSGTQFDPKVVDAFVRIVKKEGLGKKRAKA